MLVCSQLALLIAGTPMVAAAPAPEVAPSAAFEPWNHFEPEFAAIAQGTLDAHAKPWYVSVGAQFIAGDYSANVLGGADFSENPGYSLDIGFVKWSEELGVALEGGIIKSDLDVDIGALNHETVDTLRYLVGVRVFDRGSESWLPYLRGGYMFRTDSGNQIDSDGSGWYVGGGFDWYIGSMLRVGPQLLYTQSDSLDAKEWLLGAVLSVAF